MRISVIGGYGYTGKLICHELDRAGFDYTVVGRNAEKLAALRDELSGEIHFRLGDIQLTDFASEISASSDLIINCAGPFTEESSEFLRQVVESGKIYLDITGELGFVRNAHQNYHQLAEKSNALILCGCAFESLIVDLIVQVKTANKKITTITTFYWFNKPLISPGTRITMKLSKFREAFKIAERKWVSCDLINDRYQVAFPQLDATQIAVSYPLPEVAFFNWSLHPQNAQSFLLLSAEEARFIEQREQNPHLLTETYARIKKVKKNGPTALERSEQMSRIIVDFKTDHDERQTFLIENTDMYQTTAKAIVLAVVELKKDRKNLNGVLNPAQLFKGRELETLHALNCTIKSNEKITITAC